MSTLEILIPFIGGLGMFIYGMQTMAQGLENAAGDRMRSLLEVLTKNKLMGVLLGAAITAVIQSSSATTVMVVGFVNAGIMNLTQAMGVIMGANIGTTVTGWLVSSSEWAKFLSPNMLAPIAIMVGVLIMMTGKRYQTKETAKIVFGFGLLFVGISTMSGAVAPLKENEAFVSLFVTLGRNPLLGIAAGTIVTAIIQSSSASVGILQSLAAAGLVPFNAAIYIIMGQNIGTCVTAILSGLGANRNAKTAGLMHLLFNIIGTAIFSTAAILYLTVAAPVWALDAISQTQIGLIHTLFNIGTTLLLFPVSGWIIVLAKKLSRVDKEESNKPAALLDPRMLEAPAVALQALSSELTGMGAVVEENLTLASQVLVKPDRDKIQRIHQLEQTVDEKAAAISDYAVQLSALEISPQEHRRCLHILQIVSDMERISDQCENIAEGASQLLASHTTFSQPGQQELTQMAKVCTDCYNCALDAFVHNDAESLTRAIEKETQADQLESQYRAQNLTRLTTQMCNAQVGILFQDALVNLERISDHSRNIAEESAVNPL